MANLDEYKRVMGEAFRKGVAPGALIEGDGQKNNFTVKSDRSDSYINCTLWENSHGHIKLYQGDTVILSGKFTKKAKQDGDGHWLNLSIQKIGIIPMDAGVRDDEPSSQATSDDEPDVL